MPPKDSHPLRLARCGEAKPSRGQKRKAQSTTGPTATPGGGGGGGGADKFHSAVDKFLHRILGLTLDEAEGSPSYQGGARDGVHRRALALLMPPATPAIAGPADASREEARGCDVVRSLRSLLLHGPARISPPRAPATPKDCARTASPRTTKNGPASCSNRWLMRIHPRGFPAPIR